MANVSNINASRPQIQGTALDQATKLAGDSTNAKVVISKAMEVLAGANLSVTRADSSGATGAAERKTTGGTNVPALDDPGDAQQVAANLEKLVSYLQLDNQDRQTEMAKDRLEMQKGNLDAEHKDRMEQIDKSIKKMKDAEKASIWSRAFSWIGAIVAVVAAAVLTVVTGGLAAGFAIAGAAIAVSSLLLNETGAMDKIVNALADHMKSAHGMSRSDAKLAASLICNLTLCVASLGCGIGSMVSGAASAAATAAEVAATAQKAALISEQTAKTVHTAMTVASTGVGAASLATGGVSTYFTKRSEDAKADTKELEKFITQLQQRLNETEEELQQLLQQIEAGVSTIAQMIGSATDTSDEISRNLGAMA